MKEAFTYMFKDSMFLQKYLTYGLFSFFYILFLFFIQKFTMSANFQGIVYFWTLLIIISCIINGYFIKCIKAISIQQENYVLPFLNVWSCIKTGIKMSVAYFIASLVFAIPMIIPIVNIVFVIFYLYIVLALFWIFAQTEGFKSFFRIKAACKIISYSRGDYFLSLLTVTIISMLTGGVIAGSAVFLMFTTQLGIQADIIVSLLGSIVMSYSFFAATYIIAKAIKPECVEIIQ